MGWFGKTPEQHAADEAAAEAERNRKARAAVQHITDTSKAAKKSAATGKGGLGSKK